MDIKKLSNLIIERRELLQNEAQVKQGLIRPFIKELGFDPDNPAEVVPECLADIGTKKGEKVDYGIMINNKFQLLIECKYFFEYDRKTGNWKHYSDYLAQTKRYFDSCQDVEFAILTDGIHYLFFANLNTSKGMDETPFLKIDLEGISSEEEIEFLENFSKLRFDPKSLKNKASVLGRIESIKECFKSMIIDKNPADHTIKYFMDCLNAGPKTELKIQEFATYVKKGIRIGLREYMQENLNKMLSKNGEDDLVSEDVSNETSVDEIQAFHIIRAIFSEKLDDINRITYKNTTGYFAVTLDGKIRKTVCRCYLEGKKKYINFCDDGWESQTKVSILSLNDIYQYKERLLSILEKLL